MMNPTRLDPIPRHILTAAPIRRRRKPFPRLGLILTLAVADVLLLVASAYVWLVMM